MTTCPVIFQVFWTVQICVKNAVLCLCLSCEDVWCVILRFGCVIRQRWISPSLFSSRVLRCAHTHAERISSPDLHDIQLYSARPVFCAQRNAREGSQGVFEDLRQLFSSIGGVFPLRVHMWRDADGDALLESWCWCWSGAVSEPTSAENKLSERRIQEEKKEKLLGPEPEVH